MAHCEGSRCTALSRDTLSRLTGLSAVGPGPTTITDFDYTYDAAGNRLTKAQLDYTEAYTYDPLYRLTDVARTGSLTGEWHYRYDPVGNRLSAQVNSAVTTSTYNEKNQLVSSTGGGPLRVRGILDEPGTAKVNGVPASMVAGNAFEALIQATTGTNTFSVEATDYSGNVNTENYSVTATGTGATQTYDANGNLTQKVEGSVTWTYEWNAENQLTRVLSGGSEVARYKYDPNGRRVERVAGGTTTLWTYDAEDILHEVAGGVTTKYVHGPHIDEALVQEGGAGAFTQLHADGLGSVVKSTGTNGTVVASRRYDAFGNLELGTSSGYAFTGREWDAAANLAFHRARYSDPEVGGFISQDPVWPNGLSPYSYADNDPVNWIDYDGAKRMRPQYILPPSCERRVLVWGMNNGNKTNNWRNTHCMVACKLKTECRLPEFQILALGYRKEAQQALWCSVAVVFGGDTDMCRTAVRREDGNDNRQGATCPANSSCEDRCSTIQGNKGWE